MVLARTLPKERHPWLGGQDPFPASWRDATLVLSRKQGEKQVIGNGISLTVVEVQGNRVRVGIEAPEQGCILRAELVGSQDELAEPAAPSGEQDVRPTR
jgi:carbon storage regulator